jgi:hypothetical protein
MISVKPILEKVLMTVIEFLGYTALVVVAGYIVLAVITVALWMPLLWAFNEALEEMEQGRLISVSWE